MAELNENAPPPHAVSSSHFDPTTSVLLRPTNNAVDSAGFVVPRDAQALDAASSLLSSLCREESDANAAIVVPCPASMAALQIVASYLSHYCAPAHLAGPQVSWRLPRPVQVDFELDDFLTTFELTVLACIRRAGVATACQVLHTAALLQASSLGLLAGLALRLDASVDVALSALSNSTVRDDDATSTELCVEVQDPPSHRAGAAAPTTPIELEHSGPVRVGGAGSIGPNFTNSEQIDTPSELLHPMSPRAPSEQSAGNPGHKHRLSKEPPRCREADTPEIVAMQKEVDTAEHGEVLPHSVRALYLALVPEHDLEVTIPPLSAASDSNKDGGLRSVRAAVELIVRCDRQRSLRVHWAMNVGGHAAVAAIESMWRHMSQAAWTPVVWVWGPSCVVTLDMTDMPSIFPPKAHVIVTGGANKTLRVKPSVQSLRVLDLTQCTTITEIPMYCFTGARCPRLLLPSSLEKLGKRAFENSRTSLLDFSRCTKLKEFPPICFDGASCKELLFPPSLAGLSRHAFRDLKDTSLLDLSCCTELQSIPSSCFEGVSTAIRLPSSLTSLEPFAFYGCRAPIDLSRCSALTELSRSCFSHMFAPTARVLFPTSLSSLAENAFEKCDIPSIDLSQCAGLKHIPPSCFAGTACSDLRLPPSLVSIDMHAFTECNIPSVDLSQCTQLTRITAVAFLNASCTNVVLPPSLERLGANEFHSCKMETVDLSRCSRLVKLPFHCFSDATITELVLPTSLQSIDPHAFEGCRAASIDLSHCTKLTQLPRSCLEGADCGTVSLPPSLESLGASAFKLCKVASIDLSACMNLESIAGCCFFKASCTELLLPASLRSIGPHAFQGCDAPSIDLSRCEGLQEIHESCFRANVLLPSHIQRDPPSCGACCAQ